MKIYHFENLIFRQHFFGRDFVAHILPRITILYTNPLSCEWEEGVLHFMTKNEKVRNAVRQYVRDNITTEFKEDK
jgi:hypothetical protein